MRFMRRAFCTPLASSFPASGLMAYFKLRSDTQDSSGNGNHATTTSAVTYSAGGKFGDGAVFVNATPSYLILPIGAQPTGNYTFAAWVKPSSLVTPNAYAQIWADWSSAHRNVLLFMSGTNGAVELYNGDGSTGQDTSLVYASALSTSDLVLLIAARTGTTFKLSINAGLPVSRTGTKAGGSTGLGSRIGSDCLGTSSYGWGGMMSEVGIWNRELSSLEQTALYNGGVGLTYP